MKHIIQNIFSLTELARQYCGNSHSLSISDSHRIVLMYRVNYQHKVNEDQQQEDDKAPYYIVIIV